MARKSFFTVGYEFTTLPGLIAGLEKHRVKRVIDTRDVANSRRAGFSKKMLAASLDEHGIGYIHLRALGTPKAGRIANRAGRMDEFRRIYHASFEQPEAQLALREVRDLCQDQASALLCFCGNEAKCHRHIIAEALKEMGLTQKEIVFDLGK
ncbi:MAG TPA: DUF488 domain-containing protein [Hyphomonadaceae bacterium]|nr:DUF488 domain-containing protein [Hyphomonadaceae bacterium]